ncbi:MAG TPA: DUF2723 domain-containing protein [Gemmatimonadales bacterium]
MRNDPTAPQLAPHVERPPYLAAVAVFAVVLAGYTWTLAPTVTFWDAGEFIAAAKILGVPHPPGTPLFVLIGHFFGTLLPFGSFAYRTNFMTALFSAGAAACLFLLITQVLRGWKTGPHGETSTDLWTQLGGAAAAAILSAFVFTVWQNSNETEVYMVATFSIAAICWLAWLWRAARGTQRAPHILLLILYIGAVSIGNHLLTLLVGPALVGFMWHVLRTDPLPDARGRAAEWAQWTVVAGMWALLIGAGLGSTTLMMLGGLAFVGASVYAVRAGAFPFALTALAIAAVGVSTYLFLYFRAGLDPFINEAHPSTFDSLLSVIRREQYPARSPIDNPLYPSGPDNPGRSLTIIGLQILNYIQYFDWQWANGLAPNDPVFAQHTPLLTFPAWMVPFSSGPAVIGIRLPFTLAFTSLGLVGARYLYRRDQSVFWLLGLLFLTTGPALMGYMNFKPGFSLGWAQFPEGPQHEVRERDYFFTVSFQVWGLLAGLGLVALGRNVVTRVRAAPRAARGITLGILSLSLLPFALNFRAASRAHTPVDTLARDFAYDLLQSVEPYGIVFTNGDNDTFPLWYLQEVEGVRQDVSVVNLSLGNTDWYLRQLRDNPVRPFDPEQAPWFAHLAPDSPPPPLLRWTDAQIDALFPQILGKAFTFNTGRISRTFPAGMPFYVKDVLMLGLIQENAGRRAVYYSVTAGSGNWLGLEDYLTNEALVIRVNVMEAPDSTRLVTGTLMGIPVDVARTDSLANHIYRYAGLFEADTLDLDPTTRNIATNLSLAFLTLGQAYEVRGERQRSIEALQKGYHLTPNSDLAGLIRLLSEPAPGAIFGDTAVRIPDDP